MVKKFLPLKCGVAGLGFGSLVHIPVLKSLKEVKVVAVADKDLDRAKTVAAKEDIPFAFGDIKDLLKQELDVVTFALPPKQNEIACQMAAKEGLAILSEKPLATSVKAAARLAELAKGLTTAVDFEFAEIEAFRKLKELIEKQVLGKLCHLQVVWLVESFAQRNKIWSWKTDEVEGGGVVALLGCHILYLAEWLLGRAQRLSASLSCQATKKFAPERSKPAGDLLHFLLEYPTTVQLTATVSNASPFGSGHRWEAVFDQGTVILYNPGPDYLAGFSLVLKTGQGEKEILSPSSQTADGRIAAFCSLAQRFIEAVREDKKTHPDFTAGYRVQRLMDAVYRSAGQGSSLVALN